MPWIIGGAVLGSAALGFAGQSSANRSNMAMAAAANETNVALQDREFMFNADQAQINRLFQSGQTANQMQFQMDASSTAYQRAVQDMKAAGLNPMLAYSQGGASSPPGSAAAGAQAHATPKQAAMAHPMQNEWASAANSASQAATIASQAEQLQVIKAQKGLVESQTTQNLASAGQLDAQRDNIRQEMTNFETRLKKLGYETLSAYYETIQDQAKAGILKSEDLESYRYYKARAEELTAKARTAQLAIPEALAYANYYQSDVGKAEPYIRFGLDTVGSAATAAARGRFGLGLRLPRR